MRPIDADAFIEELEADAEHIESSIARMMHYAIIKDIEHAPAIDAVEVVRCKVCKYRRTEDCPMCNECGKKAYPTADNDFCSFGERKERASR